MSTQLSYNSLLHEFHNNMKAKMVVGGRMSDPFDVLVRVE